MTTAVGFILVLVLGYGVSVGSAVPSQDPYADLDSCKAAGEVSRRQAPDRIKDVVCTPVFAKVAKPAPPGTP